MRALDGRGRIVNTPIAERPSETVSHGYPYRNSRPGIPRSIIEAGHRRRWRHGHHALLAGVFINRCYDELNLSLPELVRDRFTRNTSKPARRSWKPTRSARIASAWRRSDSPKKLRRSIRPACGMAREAARDQAFVAGAVGPLGVRLEPLGPTSFAEARAMFREQIDALVEAGVDLLILETFAQSRRNARSRLRRRAKRPAPEMAIIAQVTIDDYGHLPGGTATGDLHPRAGRNGRWT